MAFLCVKAVGYTTYMEQTPAIEFEKIKEDQKKEALWWESYPTMKTTADIENSIESGFAQVIPNQGVGYKISEKVRPEFRVLENNTYEILQEISEAWLERVRQNGNVSENVFLVISSLARTEEFQQQLIEQGYPAVENSTHTKLGAFDIAIKWFATNAPDLLMSLKEVLDIFVAQEKINVIEEPTIGVYHIASKPL